MRRPAVARPLPLSAGFPRIRDLAICPQMIPGSHPTHVINDEREQTSEAMAKPEVRGAMVLRLPGNAGGVVVGAVTSGVPAVWFGTATAAWQTGQVVCVPARAGSHKMSWPQAGHENLNSLIKLLLPTGSGLWRIGTKQLFHRLACQRDDGKHPEYRSKGHE